MSFAIVNRGTRVEPNYALLRAGRPFGPLTYSRRADALAAVRALRCLPPECFEGKTMIVTDKETASARKARLDELEAVLKFDDDPERRSKAKAEYLRLTDEGAKGEK